MINFFRKMFFMLMNGVLWLFNSQILRGERDIINQKTETLLKYQIFDGLQNSLTVLTY